MNVHLVADNSEILETTHGEDIPWIDPICVQPWNSPAPSANGYLDFHTVHKARSH